MALSDKAKEARNAYMREWRRKNKERDEKRLNKYWEKKAEEMKKKKG